MANVMDLYNRLGRLPRDRDVPVRVCGRRDDGTVVVEAVIKLWVTERSAQHNAS